jgi:tripartite-type tricarboxylate transporter receptor subunit TctC
MNRRHILCSLASSMALPLMSGAHAQQAYPNKSIKLVIPSSPGGVHDIIARIWADRLQDGLGTIYVENKAGAGSIIGTVEVARAQPDGYTLLLGSNTTHVLAPLQQPNIAFHPVKDFELVSVFATTSLALLVRPDLPAQDVQSLIALAKASPGKLS